LAATYAFFLDGFTRAAARLRAFLDRSTLAQIADEPATAEALFNYLQRACHCGAIDPDDLATTGLRTGEIAMRSVAAILAARGA
jgi:hypothetical protein